MLKHTVLRCATLLTTSSRFSAANNVLAINCRCISGSSKLLAGHSHWANIKHTKAAIDKQKAQVVTRCMAEINKALRNGGSSDPKQNDKLAKALNHARSNQVRQETIDRAISSFENKAKNSTTQYVYMKGPEGTFFIVQSFTDKLAPIIHTLRVRSRKLGPFVVADAGIRNQFNELGVILVNSTKGEPAEGEGASEEKPYDVIESVEDAETIGIEVEADDIQKIENDQGIFYEFDCGPKDVNRIVKELESRNLDVISSDIEFRPIQAKNITVQSHELVQNFYNALDEIEDVEKIFDNIAVDTS